MNRTPKLSQGLLTFGAVIVILILVISPIQYYMGVWGLAVSELIFLIIAVSAAFICKCDFKSVFKLKLPPVRQFLGGALIYGGSYSAITSVLILTSVIFPELYEVADAISSYSELMSPPIAVLVMAVLPAICEEALHRGFILSSFSNVRNKWVTVLSIGIIFGIFHLDPYRFLPTAIIGGAFALIAIETESMILTMIFHFINNLVSVISMYLVTDSEVGESVDMIAGIDLTSLAVSFGFYIIVGAGLAAAGYKLIHAANKIGTDNK